VRDGAHSHFHIARSIAAARFGGHNAQPGAVIRCVFDTLQWWGKGRVGARLGRSVEVTALSAAHRRERCGLSAGSDDYWCRAVCGRTRRAYKLAITEATATCPLRALGSARADRRGASSCISPAMITWFLVDNGSLSDTPCWCLPKMEGMDSGLRF